MVCGSGIGQPGLASSHEILPLEQPFVLLHRHHRKEQRHAHREQQAGHQKHLAGSTDHHFLPLCVTSSSTSANDREHTRAALKSPPRRSRRSSDYRCVLLFLLFRVILCVLTILADDPSGTLPRYHVNWLAIITRDHLTTQDQSASFSHAMKTKTISIFMIKIKRTTQYTHVRVGQRDDDNIALAQDDAWIAVALLR